MKHRWITKPSNYAVIVVTYEGSPFLDEALEYLKGIKHPLLLCINTPDDNGYDPAGFYLAKELELEKFILLHDSCHVKDQRVLDMLFAFGGTISLSPGILMCMGKFEQLPELPPKPKNKREAVDFETAMKNWQHTPLFPTFTDCDKREYKHGKERMVIENEYLKKYKSTWSPDMIVD